MLNFIDIMRAAQGGQAIENMARRFGLNPEQTRHAVAALLPAFAMGLQQAAARPADVEKLFEAMRSGRYDAFFDSARSAFSKKAQASGEDIIGRMFGSPELVARIAEQSAAFSGLTAETVSKMMPHVAATLMGGMAKSVGSDSATGIEPLARMMDVWKPPAPEPPPPPANPWEQMFSAMMAGMQGGAAGDAAGARKQIGSENPFEEMIATMLRAGAPPEPEPPPRSDAEKAMDEAFANYEKMLQMGREMQDRHLAALRTIFADFWTKR